MLSLVSLAPIILIVCLGAWLRRSGFLSADFFKGAIRLTYYVGLPALLIEKIATAETGGTASIRVFTVLLIATVVCFIAGIVASVMSRSSRAVTGALVQAGFRGNLAFVGLPTLYYAFQAVMPPADADTWLRVGVLAIAPLIPIYNLVSVLLFLKGTNESGRSSAGRLIAQAVMNPLVASCVVGIVFAWSPLALPGFVATTFEAVGQMALPLALLGIGASLNREGFRQAGRPAFVAALIKVALCPLAGWLAAAAMGLGPIETRVALIFCSCPTAVSSYVLAEQMGGDEDTAGGAVLISTLLAALSLGLAVALT